MGHNHLISEELKGLFGYHYDCHRLFNLRKCFLNITFFFSQEKCSIIAIYIYKKNINNCHSLEIKNIHHDSFSLLINNIKIILIFI